MIEQTDRPPTVPISLRQYAKHRGVGLTAIQKAIGRGRIHPSADGKIDVEKADIEWQRNTAPRPLQRASGNPVRRSIGGLQPAAESSPSGGYAAARAIREQFLARLAKIEFEERSGKLISRDEIQVAAFNKFRTFRDGMLNIPDRVAAVLAAESDPHKVHETLTTEIRKALLEFADGTNG